MKIITGGTFKPSTVAINLAPDMKRLSLNILGVVVLAMACPACCGMVENSFILSSPDGRVQMVLELNGDGEPVYHLAYRGNAVLEASRLAGVLSAMQKANWGNWIGRLIVAVQGHYPIYLTVRKLAAS